MSCQDSKWLMSWTINRQGQFKEQDKDKVCVWVYGLFTDVPGDFVKKPMRECTGKEITEEWLYHIGVPVEQIPELAEQSAVCVPTMMPYITAFFMPRTKWRPSGCHPGWMCKLCIPWTVCRYSSRHGIYNRIFCSYCDGSRIRSSRRRPWCTGSMGQCLRYPRPARQLCQAHGWKIPSRHSASGAVKCTEETTDPCDKRNGN